MSLQYTAVCTMLCSKLEQLWPSNAGNKAYVIGLFMYTVHLYKIIFIRIAITSYYVIIAFTPQIKGIPEDAFAMYTSTQGDI